MLKKLDLMSESLQRIANDQDMQKQLLAQVLEEIRSQKDLYELQLEINALQAKTAEFVDIALNFEEYMKPFMGSFQSLLSNVATVDQELSKAMGEIQNIANLLEAQQFRSIESDRDSQRIADFLARGEIKKDRLQEALEQMGNASSGAEFDAQLLGTGKGITINDCLGNIRDFLDVKLDNLKMDLGAIDVPVTEVNEPDVNFYAPDSFEDVIKLDLGNGVALELLRVPAGSFAMGEHQVTLREFFIGKYPVTNAQWQAVMKAKGSANCDKKFQGDLQPVVGVSWHEARAFCLKVQEKAGRAVRLPTEAEWEYAARGGNQSKGYEYAGSNNLDEVGWYDKNSGAKTSPVGQKLANELGIYDMSGNVWEWCLDEWHDSYADKPDNLKKQGNQAWGDLNVDNNDNRYRLLRGGSWNYSAWDCRSVDRNWNNARVLSDFIGFRLLLASSS
jgi:formylglycine-generating enzyme required for sulfatase activity